jgi:anti-anti-sigma factor
MMEFSDSKRGTVLVVTLNGKLDTIEAEPLHKHLRGRIQAGANRIVLDASKLTYICSTGLRVMILAARQVAEASGRIVVCGLNQRLQGIFATMGFSRIFDVYDSLEEAVKGVEVAS